MTIYSRISGTGSYLPPRRLTNADLVAELATQGIESSDDWIVERTGIRARHFVGDGVGSSDLGAEAAKRAMAAAGCQPADIDLIIVATSTPDWCFLLRLHCCKTNWALWDALCLMFKLFAVVLFTP